MKNPLQYSSNTPNYTIDQKNILGISLLLLLALHFTLNYLAHTYYFQNLLERGSPGYWLYITSCFIMALIVYLDKKYFKWSWSFLGFSKPKTWWKDLLVFILTFLAIVLFGKFIRPLIEGIGGRLNIEHLMVLKQNFSGLISALITVWITAAFLEELVFRAFLINSLELLIGRSVWSTMAAVLISSIIFGAIHAYQGITGILTTMGIGLIFGLAFIFNGRRIWPLILVHGIIDTISLITIYNMA